MFARALSRAQCPLDFNPLQEDADADGLGDACDACSGGGGASVDADGDGVDDACDVCPGTPSGAGTVTASGCTAAQVDVDGDGVCTGPFDPSLCMVRPGSAVFIVDNCAGEANPPDGSGMQPDADGDGIGDACDGNGCFVNNYWI